MWSTQPEYKRGEGMISKHKVKEIENLYFIERLSKNKVAKKVGVSWMTVDRVVQKIEDSKDPDIKAKYQEVYDDDKERRLKLLDHLKSAELGTKAKDILDALTDIKTVKTEISKGRYYAVATFFNNLMDKTLKLHEIENKTSYQDGVNDGTETLLVAIYKATEKLKREDVKSVVDPESLNVQ